MGRTAARVRKGHAHGARKVPTLRGEDHVAGDSGPDRTALPELRRHIRLLFVFAESRGVSIASNSPPERAWLDRFASLRTTRIATRAVCLASRRLSSCGNLCGEFQGPCPGGLCAQKTPKYGGFRKSWECARYERSRGVGDCAARDSNPGPAD